MSAPGAAFCHFRTTDKSLPSTTEINRLGKRLGVRQQAMATAQVYIKRFYIKVEIRKTNPFLVITTALYLACKMEECPQHIRLVNQEARSLWAGTVALRPRRDETPS